MKLLICTLCHDVFKVGMKKVKSCDCGKTQGQYVDNLYAEFMGDYAVPLGFANSTLIDAIRKQPEEGLGKEFKAFVIQKKCDTFYKVSKFTEFKEQNEKVNKKSKRPTVSKKTKRVVLSKEK